MNFGNILPTRVDLLERTALSMEGSNAVSYRDLIELRDSYASALLAHGVREGDRIGMMLKNCVEYWAIHLAVGAVGAISVRINFRLSQHELNYVLEDSGCSRLFVHDTIAEALGARPSPGTLREVVVLAEHSGGRQLAPWAIDAQSWLEAGSRSVDISIDRTLSPHMIMYTSGTTGRPKGAVWTHKSTIAFGLMQLMQWGSSQQSVSMTVGPLYHVGSMEDLLLPTLMSGGHCVMTRSGNFDLGRLLGTISRLHVTEALLFPAMIYELLRRQDLHDVDLSSLRLLLTGGSPLNESAVSEFRRRFPAVELWSVYGLTEGGGISTALSPSEGRLHPSSAGRPLPMASLRIVSEDGKEAPLGSVGEICVRGPNTAVKYWNHREESAATFVDGWVQTGDLGWVDRDGVLTVTGRAKDMIRTGDENVYAAEVERVLALLENVTDAAVIGVPDQKFGEAVAAIMVLRYGTLLTPAEVVEHCRAHLAGYKKPRFVAFVEDLPRNPTAKVVKQTLREMIASGQLSLLPTVPNEEA